MLRPILSILILAVLAFGQAKPDAKPAPKTEAAIPVDAEQAAWLTQATAALQRKEEELSLMRLGLNTGMEFILRNKMGLDPNVWMLRSKEGGGFEAVKRPEPAKPQPKP